MFIINLFTIHSLPYEKFKEHGMNLNSTFCPFILSCQFLGNHVKTESCNYAKIVKSAQIVLTDLHYDVTFEPDR